MATAEQVRRLRLLANYNETEPYDDPMLSSMIDQSSVYDAASEIWAQKAAKLSALVNTSESGSSRSMGDAYKNALAMSKHYSGLAKTEDEVETGVGRARTRAIVRETAG